MTATAVSLAPHQQAERHLHALFAGELDVGEFYEMRCLDCSREPAGEGPRGFYRSITALVDEAMRLAEHWDVFYGVGLRRCPTTTDIRRCPHEKKGVDHISRLPGAWADVDVCSGDEPNKPHATLEGATSRLLAVPHPPSILIASGTGIHAYWPLPEPTPGLARIAALNRSIRDSIQGDNAIDPARILRLAGTVNYKHGTPLPVELLHCEPTS